MNLLVIGNGGREHALAWKLSQSPLCSRLFAAPGNPGTAQLGTNLNLDPLDFELVKQALREHHIGMVVVGPEVPLAAGLRDALEKDLGAETPLIIGPGQQAAQLESSKAFSKAFMERHNIPTAPARSFRQDQYEEAKAFLTEIDPPYVLKADGLAAGKGVLILETFQEAEEALRSLLLEEKFGAASQRVLIETFMQGRELSVFALVSGRDYLLLPEAQDYKRIGEANTGPNTGGMGAVSPVPFADEAFMEQVRHQVLEPTLQGLEAEGLPYLGFLFLGLMEVNGQPKVVEYNVRLGDPETQAILPRLEGDLLQALELAARGRLSQAQLGFCAETALTLVLASQGYPEGYAKGQSIRGTEEVAQSLVFQAGTRQDPELGLVNSGGRVLALTATGQNAAEARHKTLADAEKIRWEGKYFRRDIGQ